MAAFGQSGFAAGYGSQRRQNSLRAMGQMDPFGGQVRSLLQPQQNQSQQTPYAAYAPQQQPKQQPQQAGQQQAPPASRETPWLRVPDPERPGELYDPEFGRVGSPRPRDPALDQPFQPIEFSKDGKGFWGGGMGASFGSLLENKPTHGQFGGRNVTVRGPYDWDREPELRDMEAQYRNALYERNHRYMQLGGLHPRFRTDRWLHEALETNADRLLQGLVTTTSMDDTRRAYEQLIADQRRAIEAMG